MNKILVENSQIPTNNKQDFIVGKNNNYLFTIEKSGDYELDFSHKSNNSNSKIVILIFCNNSKIKLKLISQINAMNSSSNIIILNFALNGEIDIIGTLEINKNGTNSQGSLDIENIFIGSKSKIKTIPALLIHLEKVESRHSVKVTKINDDEIFYLNSRGISQDNAKYIILKSKIIKALNIFGNVEENILAGILDKFEKFIITN